MCACSVAHSSFYATALVAFALSDLRCSYQSLNNYLFIEYTFASFFFATNVVSVPSSALGTDFLEASLVLTRDRMLLSSIPRRLLKTKQFSAHNGGIGGVEALSFSFLLYFLVSS